MRWRQFADGWMRDAGFATLAGLLLGLVGPFGTYLTAPLFVRLAYWIGLFWIGALVYGVAVRTGVAAAARWKLAPALALAGAVALAAAPMSLAVALTARRLWPDLADVTFLDWYWRVLLVTAPCVAIYWAVFRMRTKEAAEETASAPTVAAGPARLFARSPKIGGELYCLEMQDHYVRVHSSAGVDLVLMRLADAIAEAGVEGLRVHRSWWVARAAVSEVTRAGRLYALKLKNGVTAPVARSSVAALRAAGWIS